MDSGRLHAGRLLPTVCLPSQYKLGRPRCRKALEEVTHSKLRTYKGERDYEIQNAASLAPGAGSTISRVVSDFRAIIDGPVGWNLWPYGHDYGPLGSRNRERDRHH